MENTWESFWKTVGVFAILAVVGYSIYVVTFGRPVSEERGGAFTNMGKKTTTIDCREPGMENSPYCSGEYESQAQQEDYSDSAYYQNIVR